MDDKIPGIDRPFTEEEHTKLLRTGMFFVLFPELTGNYEKDKEIFLREQGTHNNNSKTNDP